MMPIRRYKCRSPKPTIERVLGALELKPMRGVELAHALCVSRDLIRRTLSPAARSALGVDFKGEVYARQAPMQYADS